MKSADKVKRVYVVRRKDFYVSIVFNAISVNDGSVDT